MCGMFARSLVVMLCACAAHAAEEGPAKSRDTLIRWNAVEVITNDFDSVGRIREVAGLPPGTILDVTDLKLKAVCDAVRKELASSKVVCTNVIGPRTTPEGPPTAWYIVEVNIADREQPMCPLGDGSLPEDLVRLYESWMGTLTDAIFTGVPVRERVNDKKYLDYDHAELSSLATRLHIATDGRERELEAAASSCDPSLRSTSFYLMNFVGAPQRFVRLAGSHINDPHLGVANAATRFLITFAEFVPKAERPGLATQACRSLQESGFLARNKSLMLLNAWRKSKALSFDQLAPDCQRQVRDIARTSLAEQIALPARELLYPPAR